MPDRPTLHHARLSELTIGGHLLAITSAELVDIQHWDGDRAAQREWEITGRTTEDRVVDGVVEVLLTIDGRRRRGRGVASSVRSTGLTAFTIVGMGDLVEVRDRS